MTDKQRGMMAGQKDKCQGCNNVKGCITCVDSSEWAHFEEAKVPKVFEDMLNAKTPVESLGISQEKWNKIEEECVLGKEEPSIVITLDGQRHRQVWHKGCFSKKECKEKCSLYERCQSCSIDLCMIFFHDPHCHFEEESVSEDFEEALAQEWKGYNDRGAATVDALEDNTQELAFAKGFYHGWHYRKEEPVSSIWHDSNKEQPNYASTVAIWNPKYKNGEIISRCTEVYSDRIWAYIDDLLKI